MLKRREVEWLGRKALYEPHEEELMRSLPKEEAAVIHALKAELDARVLETHTSETRRG